MLLVPTMRTGLAAMVIGGLAAFLAGCGVSSVNDVQPSSHVLSSAQLVEPGKASAVGADPRLTEPQSDALNPSSTGATSTSTTANNSTRDTATIADETAKRKLREIAKDASSKSSPGSKGYKIGPQDVLQISVFKVPDLSKSIQVSEVGTINYPLIGEMEVSDKTAREIEVELTKILGAKYLQKPQVTVFVSQYNSQRVTIEGAVKKPGIYPLQSRMSLLQLVASAGGLDDSADDEVVVLRSVGTKREAARFSISELRGGGANAPNLQPGDVVIAHTSVAKQAFKSVLQALPLARIFVPF